MTQLTLHSLDEPPAGPSLTVYDQEHMALYLRLMDAERDGADWHEVVRILFDLDPVAEPERCLRVHTTHLARAQWIRKHGFRELISQNLAACRGDASMASGDANSLSSMRQPFRES